MGSVVERLQFLVGLNADEAVRGFNKLGKSAEGDLKKVEKSLDQAGARMSKFGAGAMAFAGVAGVALVSMGQDAAEMGQAVDRASLVFGEASARVLAFGDTAAKSIGQSKEQALDAAAGFGDLFTKLELGESTAADMSVTMVRLASDMASFKGADPTEVINAQAAAFRGEYDALQKFLPSINDAAVKQQAMAMGLAETADQLTAQDKALATYQLMVDGAGKAAGHFAANSDELVQSQKIATAQFADFRAELGEAVIPIMGQVVSVGSGVLGFFDSLPEPIQDGIGKLVAFGVAGTGAVGAVSLMAGQVIKARDQITSFASSLGKMNPVLLATGGALVAGAALYASYRAEKAKAEELTREFVDALQAEAKGNKDAINALIAKKLVEGDLIDTAKEYGVTLDDLVKLIKGGTVPAFDELREKQLDQGFSWRTLVGGGGDYNTELVSLIETIDAMTGAHTGAIKVNEREAEVVEKLTEVHQELGITVDKTAEQMAYWQGKADEMTAAAERQEESLRELIDATFAATDSSFAYQEAQWQAEDAVRALTEAEQTAFPFSRELAAASIEAERAILDQAQAAAQLAIDQAELNGATLTASERADVLRGELQKLKEKFPELAGPIQNHIDKLRSIPSKISTILEIRQKFIDDKILNDNYGGGDVQRSVQRADGGFSTVGVDTAQAAGRVAPQPVQVILNVDGRELSTAQASASWGRVRAMGLG